MGPKRIPVPAALLDLGDDQLVSKLLNGEEDALAALMKRYGGAVFRNARGIVGNDAEAQEATQQVFLEIFRDLKRFDSSKSSFKSWLMRRAFSRARDSRRHLRYLRRYLVDEFDDTAVVEHMDVLFNLIGQEQSQFLAELLSRLPEKERDVIRLKYFSNLTLREIAAGSGEPVSTVAGVLQRGIKMLRALILENTQTSQNKSERKRGVPIA
jgi:RNA polymerase sigma-70 factor, ECF subfamily